MAKATSPTYRVPFRRRREGRTRYKKRIAYLKSGLPRLVVRKTNRGIIVQLIEFGEAGDKTIVSVTRKQLKAYGWEGKRNTPSAYLEGMIAAKLAKKKGVKKVILDIGLHTPTKGSLVFAAAIGAKDAGLDIDIKAEVPEERIKGGHISAYAEKAKEHNSAQFKAYEKAKVNVKELPKLFESVKEKIMKG